MASKKSKKKATARKFAPTHSGKKPGRRFPSTRKPEKSDSAGFLVDEKLNVVEFIGNTAPFLSIRSGPASLSLRGFLNPGLRRDVMEALELAKAMTHAGMKPKKAGKPKAKERERAVRRRVSNVRIEGRSRCVDLEVVPVRERGRGVQWKILFESQGTARTPRSTRSSRLGSRVVSPDPSQESISLEIDKHQQEFRALLDQEARRHAALRESFTRSDENVESTQAELEGAYAELEALNSELRAILAERDEIEQRLRKSEAASRELMETAAQGIIVIDSGERILRVNGLACTMFGYAPEELLGHKLGALIPEGLRRAHSVHVAGFVQDPQRRPMGRGRDLWGRRKDGTRFPIEVGLSSVERENEARWFVSFVSDITERKRSEGEIQRHREQLQQLNARLVSASEEANRHWARELHDVFSQRLVAMAMKIAALANEVPQSQALRSVEDEACRLARDVHQLSRQIHPTILHDLGLGAALKQELAAFGQRHAIETEFRSHRAPDVLSDEVRLALYRIAQEALRNIQKHSEAQSVRIELDGTHDAVLLRITDEGNGFELGQVERRGGLGLVSMEERSRAVGGEFSIESIPSVGTVVRVRVPLKERQ